MCKINAWCFKEKKPARRIYAKKKIKYKLKIKKRVDERDENVNEEDDRFVDVEDDNEEDDAVDEEDVDEEDVAVDEDVDVDEEEVLNEEDDGGEEDVDVDEEDHVSEEEFDAVTIEDIPKYRPSFHDKKKRPYSGSNKQAQKSTLCSHSYRNVRYQRLGTKSKPIRKF